MLFQEPGAPLRAELAAGQATAAVASQPASQAQEFLLGGGSPTLWSRRHDVLRLVLPAGVLQVMGKGGLPLLVPLMMAPQVGHAISLCNKLHAGALQVCHASSCTRMSQGLGGAALAMLAAAGASCGQGGGAPACAPRVEEQ